MKTLKSLPLTVLTLAASALAGVAQPVYSLNVIGYYNRPLSPGNNLIANQLGYGVWGQYTNTLDNILSGSVADGSTFTKWDPQANQFLPVSTYSAAQTNWSINYTLDLGEGGLLHSPVVASNIFVGEVNGSIFNIDTGEYYWSPNYASGLYLLSSPVPFSAATFEQVVGRSPVDGEWVKILDEITQTYSTTTYHAGVGWDNGDPILSIGQAAWFDLGPVQVPEPSSALLLAAVSATLLRLRQSLPERRACRPGGR